MTHLQFLQHLNVGLKLLKPEAHEVGFFDASDNARANAPHQVVDVSAYRDFQVISMTVVATLALQVARQS